jgi:hypothetical protein
MLSRDAYTSLLHSYFLQEADRVASLFFLIIKRNKTEVYNPSD